MNIPQTPVYVIDEDKLKKNLETLKGVQRRTGCKILLAQKAFSCFYFYPLISEYLAGFSSSGLYEARLANEEGKGENHIFCPAYTTEEFGEIADICTHINFNSAAQLKSFYPLCKNKQVGLRLNPQFSTQKTPAYDPCAFGSRMGVTKADFDEELLPLLNGFHIHTLCEQGAEDFAATVKAAEEKFGEYFKKVQWLNLGGGHHITKAGYNIPLLERTVSDVMQKYGVQVYLEPGEAIALNAGKLYTKVLDIVKNGIYIAVLDASAECHAPDVIEMPYTPPLTQHKEGGAYTYRLSSRTCLTGDVFGDYSFEKPLKTGDILSFEDMAIYSIVKNNTFNGMPLPAIAVERGGKIEIIKRFSYSDFKGRLS